MTKPDLKSPDLYLNRELSWLEFNDRVLREGLSDEVPLLERLKFLAIVSSNLDEFYMIRVAGLMQQRSAGVVAPDFSGLTPAQQLSAISARAHRMVAEQTAGMHRVLAELAGRGLRVLERGDWTGPERKFLRTHFTREVLPVLTPLAVETLHPCPVLPGLRLQVGLVVRTKQDDRSDEMIAVVRVPGMSRFVDLPAQDKRSVRLARLEDVIAEGADMLFPGCEVLGTAVFRITRDADIEIQDDDASDLLHTVEQAVLARRRRAAVRLEVSAGADPRIVGWLCQNLQLSEEETFEIDGMLDATALFALAARPGLQALAAPDWPPQRPQDLLGVEDEEVWDVLQERDVLLFHPYESFEPVVRLVELAAEDPKVVAIKQTLYRTSGDSPIVKALERAAANGKEVTALVELKARFDEARNVAWARRLEDAGCNVVYGIVGLKTHAKALLIVRREASRIRRYVHLSTGNYNDRTARLYSDVGLLTANRDIAADVAALFNLLTGYSEAVGWSKLTVEPGLLKERFIELIEREANVSTPDRPGLIMAKVNSLQDREIIRALYRASRAGVKIQLNVRGICCLRPGVPGISETIEVRSIVDRFLEHARIFYFQNGGHEEVYLSSADWMHRNLDKRLEIIFPVVATNLRRRLIEILRVYFADNVKARQLQPDGTYCPVPRDDPPVRAQEHFYREAVEAVHAAERSGLRFQPLTPPKEA
jgi:polyphosphate kinase